MTTPGFTAEASLYTSKDVRSGANRYIPSSGQFVVPQRWSIFCDLLGGGMYTGADGVEYCVVYYRY
jgi:hypothetical protein